MTPRDAGGGPGSRLADARVALAPAVWATVLAVALVLILAGVALAASPSPTVGAGGDPRSSGQGPGLVGDPLAAIAGVAMVAIASLAATLLYVRLTGGGRDTRPRA